MSVCKNDEAKSVWPLFHSESMVQDVSEAIERFKARFIDTWFYRESTIAERIM